MEREYTDRNSGRKCLQNVLRALKVGEYVEVRSRLPDFFVCAGDLVETKQCSGKEG